MGLRRDQDGNIVRFKARLIATGNAQVYAVAYLDADLLRILLELTAIEGLDEMDVVTQFLAGDINDNIHMERPTGFEMGIHAFKARRYAIIFCQSSLRNSTRIILSLSIRILL